MTSRIFNNMLPLQISFAVNKSISFHSAWNRKELFWATCKIMTPLLNWSLQSRYRAVKIGPASKIHLLDDDYKLLNVKICKRIEDKIIHIVQ